MIRIIADSNQGRFSKNTEDSVRQNLTGRTTCYVLATHFKELSYLVQNQGEHLIFSSAAHLNVIISNVFNFNLACLGDL